MALRIPVKMEACRVHSGPLASDASYGANEAFRVRCPNHGELAILISDGEGGEHVSVSTKSRHPVWEEMEWVKRQFWEASDTMMQLHVPVAAHINCHPFCLYLWRPVKGKLPRPEGWLVGPTARIAKSEK